MGVLTLNIEFRERGIKKTMQFEPRIVVYDACRLIRDKLGPLNENPNNYEYYLIRNGDTLEYKNKFRQLRVRTLDGGTVKTLYVDESLPVSQLMINVCSKMGIANHEEYSLVRSSDINGATNGVTNGETNGYHREQRGQSVGGHRTEQPNGKDSRFENTFMNTIGRKKEKQHQQLRAKLHTDEDIAWVDHSKTLREQNIGENEELVLRRKFFFSDTNVDTRDPVQLNLLYLQCRDGVLKGLHPVSRETAIKLAALQCWIEYGPFQEGVQRSIDAKDLLPKEYAKAKEHEKNIIQEYRELMYEDQAAPKKKYCELCQSLPTYGQRKVAGKKSAHPRLLGVNKESVMRVDERTKAVLKDWPLEQVRRWAASYKTFTLDFGDYKDGYYSVQTLDGEKICQLIGGYIDIIMKKKRIADHTGIEGDEGSTMLEDIVAPARATLIAHGEIGQGYAHDDGHVALPGVLRSAAGTPGQDIWVQYGAIGGRIIAQEMPRSERVRYVDSQERSQRALIGTIEATIRAVEEAEEEIAKPPQIDLPKFDQTSRHWRVEVEKESVGDRLAAMGAATAEVVQLTAIPDENYSWSVSDNRVGTAIATIGSNLPEMGRGVRDLAAMLPDEHQAGDLIEAARKLCGAFGTFLDKVHPDKNEKRATILSAASRVGELSHDMINTIHEESTEDRSFHDQLNQRARNVATSTAKLVLQAKTVSADCDEPALKEKVIHSAMKTAFATSELIACTRVVGPTIDHPPCREHLTEAAHNVARSVEELLVDANGACKRTISNTGEQQYSDLHAAARQVSNALDDLIEHVKLSPASHPIFQPGDHQPGPSRDLMRDSESAIRHSRMLVDEFENEAQSGGPDQRDKLLSAARSVAQATSNMIEVTKDCQGRPQEAEAQEALRTAAENLVQVTSDATNTSVAATQTIAAANAARPHLQSRNITETLIVECSETSRYIPPVVQRIKESQASQTAGPVIDSALNPALSMKPLNLFSLLLSWWRWFAQLYPMLTTPRYWTECQETAIASPSRRYCRECFAALANSCRSVGSSVAQLISAAKTNDRQHVGASTLEVAQSLRSFTNSIHAVAATRPNVPVRVIHDSGRVFDRVRERSAPSQLEESARIVSESLRKTLSCLPDNAAIEQAIERIQRASLSRTGSPVDIRQAAAKLIESSMDVFVASYEHFYGSVAHIIQKAGDQPQKQPLMEHLEATRDQALNVLQRLRSSHTDPNNLAYTQSLSKPLGSSWARECDNALQQINSMRYVLDDNSTLVPLNNNSYYESLSEKGGYRTIMHGCPNRGYAVCGLAENAAQSAYLIGAGDRDSQPGKPAIFDTISVIDLYKPSNKLQNRLSEERRNCDSHTTSNLATICREASEHSNNVTVKRQFVNCARDITSATASLIHAVKKVDQQPTDKNHNECREQAHQLLVAAENLEAFIDNPEFGVFQLEFLRLGEMLKSHTAKIWTLTLRCKTWQRIANSSSIVSESIKHLVAAIRDEAPGQAELDGAIQRLGQLIQEVDGAAIAASQQQTPSQNQSNDQLSRQQILHASQILNDRIEPLKVAGISHAEAIGYTVREHMNCIENLVHSTVQTAASSYDSAHSQPCLINAKL
uniref:FERM domain-containing protein n=1 Tax=Ditylenchus dipsaci TaxID=166011 RepID=A0A915D8I4_9BILA